MLHDSDIKSIREENTFFQTGRGAMAVFLHAWGMSGLLVNFLWVPALRVPVEFFPQILPVEILHVAQTTHVQRVNLLIGSGNFT